MRVRNALVAMLCVVAAACGGEADNGGQAAEPTESPDVGATPTGQTSCSAATLSTDFPPPAGLPAPVAETRSEILQAAVNCDYEELAALGMEPDGAFQYSTEEESAGPDAKPAEFWAAQEEAGAEPMAHLIGILSGEPVYQPVTEQEDPGSGSEEGYYNWPAAADPAGWKTAITAGGDWIFFLREGPP